MRQAIIWTKGGLYNWRIYALCVVIFIPKNKIRIKSFQLLPINPWEMWYQFISENVYFRHSLIKDLAYDQLFWNCSRVNSWQDVMVSQHLFRLWSGDIRQQPIVWANDNQYGNTRSQSINSFPLGQNGRHFADDTLRCIVLKKNAWILIKISLNFVSKGSVNNIPALVQIMAWCRISDRSLSEPMLTLLTDASRARWVDTQGLRIL